MRFTPHVCFVAGACLVIITIIIPYGVFTRFVLNSASSWPEPLAVLLMIWLAFLSAVVCYREIPAHRRRRPADAMLTGTARAGSSASLIEVCMLVTNLFMFWWGIKLVQATWFQSIAEFPVVSVGVSYLPVPIGGLLIVLFVIERMWTPGVVPGADRSRPPAPSPQNSYGRSSARHGCPRPHRQLRRVLPAWACRSPMHSALPRSSGPFGSVCRSKRSC